MKTFTVTTFKAQALKVIDQIVKTRESIIITKRGKPVVEVSPFTLNNEKPIPGKLKHFYKSENDIVSPLSEDLWKAAK